MRRAAASLTLLLAASSEAAQAQESWLSWNAPPECRNTEEVERRLTSLLDRRLDTTQLPASRASLAWIDGQGWQLDVAVGGNASRHRRVVVQRCSDAFDVIALALALVLEPDRAFGAEVGDSDTTGADGLDAAPAEDFPAAPALEAAAPPADLGSPAPFPQPETGTSTFSLSAAAVSDFVTFPEPQLGAAISAALAATSSSLEIEAGFLGSSAVEFTRAAHEVRFWTMFGKLDGCLSTGTRDLLAWVGCVGGQGGIVMADEIGGDQRRPSAPWLALQLGAGPMIRLAERWRVYLRVNGLALLNRHEFGLESGQSVHRLPRASLQLALGVSFDLTESGSGEH